MFWIALYSFVITKFTYEILLDKISFAILSIVSFVILLSMLTGTIFLGFCIDGLTEKRIICVRSFNITIGCATLLYIFVIPGLTNISYRAAILPLLHIVAAYGLVAAVNEIMMKMEKHTDDS